MAKKVQVSVDRISSLPDETLCHIISFLPTKDAVCTSILSTRWRYLSAFTSNLDFEYNYDWGTLDAFMNFVDRVLFLRKRPTIDRFRLHCRASVVDHLRIDGWIHVVLCQSIRELDLYTYCLGMPHGLLAGFFICKTLVVLRLSKWVCLKVPARVFLPSLKVLDLHCCFEDKEFGKWLSFGCPVLEDLVLAGELLDEKCKLNISHASLKRLTVGIQSSPVSSYDTVEIIVNAQNLVYLKYCGDEDNSFSFINLPSLTEAWIDFSQSWGDSTIFLSSISRLMEGIKSIRFLDISSETLWDLNFESVPLPLFLNLSCLKTSLGVIQSFLGLVRLLQHSNFLETLVMEEMPNTDYDNDWRELDRSSVPCTDLPFLKAIEILKFERDECHIYIVKYFLENAKVLENLTICISGEEKEQLEISKELMMFPRVSKKCEVSFLVTDPKVADE